MTNKNTKTRNTFKIMLSTLALLALIAVILLNTIFKSGWSGNRYLKYGRPITGLTEIEGHTYYFDSNNNNEYITGNFETPDGQKRVFDSKGVMQTEFWDNPSTNVYNYYKENGTMARNEIVTIDGEERAFDENGKNIYHIYNKKLREPGPDSNYRVGPFKYNNEEYYFDENTKEYFTGVKEDGDEAYYYNEQGIKETGAIKVGDDYMLADENGKLLKGLLPYESNEVYAGDNYKLQKGIVYTKDAIYFFDDNYKRQTGWVDYKDNTYYFTDTGIMLKGFNPVGDNTYYFNEDGQLQKGLTKVDDKTYYLDSKTGAILTGNLEVDGKEYYFGNDGSAVTGFVKVDGKTYYYNPHKTYSTKIEGTPYYTGDDGVVYSDNSSGRDYDGKYFYVTNDHNVTSYYVGERFIEIDLSNQYMKVYNNGKVSIESPIVSGAPHHPTITGGFTLYAKERNATLRGNNDNGSKYATPVSYWMPFSGGYGLHDAYWQNGAYGDKTAYKWRGSHGCVNLPPHIAKQVFELVEVGDAVIVYW